MKMRTSRIVESRTASKYTLLFWGGNPYEETDCCSDFRDDAPDHVYARSYLLDGVDHIEENLNYTYNQNIFQL